MRVVNERSELRFTYYDAHMRNELTTHMLNLFRASTQP
jgi:hypothetical protein